MAMTTDKSSISGRSENQATVTRTEKTKSDNHEALKLDEVAGRSMGINKQKLMFMSGHQLIQMAETEIVKAHNKNQTSTDQSHTKRSFNISRVKRSVEKDRPKQEEEIKDQTKQSSEWTYKPTSNQHAVTVRPSPGVFQFGAKKLGL